MQQQNPGTSCVDSDLRRTRPQLPPYGGASARSHGRPSEGRLPSDASERKRAEQSEKGDPKGSPLGTSRTELPLIALERMREARKRRYRRRQRSSEWLIRSARLDAGLPPVAEVGTTAETPDWVRPARAARCRWRVSSTVGVHHAGGQAPAHWSGVERCSSIWACPVCSAVVRAKRAAEIQAAADAWRAQGGFVVMVTLTMRHRRSDPLAVTLDAAVAGWKKMLQRRAWRSAAEWAGLKHYVRAVEVTRSDANGWHPHIHALLFLDRPLDEERRNEFASAVYDVWAGIVVSLGAGKPSRANGVRVTTTGADATYVAKIQEHDRADRTGAELARTDLKASRAAEDSGGMMPFELLDRAPDDHQAFALWREYFSATHGRRAITWSRNLRTDLDLDAEQTDEELLAETVTAVQRIVIPGEAYDRLRNRPGRLTRILAEVERGALDAAAYLSGGFVLPPDVPPDWSPPRAGHSVDMNNPKDDPTKLDRLRAELKEWRLHSHDRPIEAQAMALWILERNLSQPMMVADDCGATAMMDTPQSSQPAPTAPIKHPPRIAPLY